MENYKEDIVNSRVGSLGSSDAEIVASIARAGGVIGRTNRERIAVMLGQTERKDFSNYYTQLGDRLEGDILEVVRSAYSGYEVKSNPVYKYKELSAKCQFDVINHIDYEIETESELIWVENKACRGDLTEVASRYDNQLQWHWLGLAEKSAELGKKPILLLSHYRTGVTDDSVFDSNNLTIVSIMPYEPTQTLLLKGLDIINNIVPNFVWDGDDSEVDVMQTTPEIALRSGNMSTQLRQLKELESKISEYKAMLKAYIEENIGKSVVADDFRIVYKAESTSNKFDAAAFKKDHPDLYNQYLKESKVASSISVQLK